MATLVINCDGSSSSFENNGNIRITYTAGNGSVTVTEIEGMRTDGYSSYEDASQTIKLTIGGVAKTINVTRVRFMANSAYATWGLTDTTWTGLSGSVNVVLSGLTHWSGAAYYNKTFTATGAINAGNATYSIKYRGRGGSPVPADQAKATNVAVTLSNTVPAQTGYEFLGWSIYYHSMEPLYQPGDTYTNNADLTLHAVWRPLPRVKVLRSGTYVAATDIRVRSGSSWVRVGDINLKANGDF